MKNTDIIVLLLITSGVSAQKLSQLHLLEAFSNPQHPHILAISFDKKAEGGSRYMTERLIGYKAESFTAGSWVGSDSINYSYTGAKGDANDAENTCTLLNNFEYVNSALVKERRRTNTFNTNNQLVSYIEETWDGNGWVNTYKYQYTYTPSGLQETSIQQEWQGNTWVNQYKSANQYNSAGLTLTDVLQTWTNNVWVNSTRSVYTFDGNNFETSYSYESWVNSAWNPSMKYTTAYNASGNIEEQLYQENFGSGLENREKTTYSYNASFKMIESLQQVWVLSSLWLNDSRYVYSYNGNGTMGSNTKYLWNSNTNIWENDKKYSYSYDAAQNKIQETTEEWLNAAWVNMYQYVFAYNSANIRTYQKSATWINNAWRNNFQDNYVFDANGFKLSDQRDNWVNNAWAGSNKRTTTPTAYGNTSTSLYQTWQNNTLTNVSRTFYYYESFDNGLSSITENTFGRTSLYPNPAGNFVNVEFASTQNENITVNVLSVTGNLVLSETLQSNNGDNRIVFDSQKLANGFYTIQLKSATAESSIKFIVSK
jgi:hypothetical protein